MALSGSRTDTKAPKDEFQDYDVVYVVENLDELITDLSWLDQFGKRIIEQRLLLTIVVYISCSLKMVIALIYPLS